MRVLINKIMGKAFSCCFRRKEQGVDPIDETTRLLTPSKINDSNCWPNISGSTLGSFTDLLDTTEENCDNESSQNKTVEQNLAKNIIDITAIDRPIDRSEWEERLKSYEERVKHIERPLTLTSKALSNRLPEEPVSERIFKPIEEEDLRLITYLSERAAEAVHQGFQIRSEDSFVVNFNAWTRS